MNKHKVWKVGDDVDTDTLAPGAYMKFDLKTITSHCLEASYPGLVAKMQPGDVLVAGKNFGVGSSREQAVGVLIELGIQAVIAPSFSGLYFRNAFNLGLLVIECGRAHDIPEGSYVSIDLVSFKLDVYKNKQTKRPTLTLPINPIPDFLIQLVKDGGLLKQLEKKYAAKSHDII